MDVILYFQPSAKSSAPGKLYGVQEIAAVNGWHVQTIEGPISRERIAELRKFWHPVGAIAECGSESARSSVMAGNPDTEQPVIHNISIVGLI